MKQIIFMLIIALSCFVHGETNVTGTVEGSFFLLTEVGETNGKIHPPIEMIELPSGQRKPKDFNQIIELINKSPRVYIVQCNSPTNRVIHVLATYPFPKISGGVAGMDENIFITGNIVDLKLSKIEETEYRDELKNLFVYSTNYMNKNTTEPYPALKEQSLFENSKGFFKLKNVSSFTMTHPEAQPNNWYTLYSRYKTKIIITDKLPYTEKKKLFEPSE